MNRFKYGFLIWPGYILGLVDCIVGILTLGYYSPNFQTFYIIYINLKTTKQKKNDG